MTGLHKPTTVADLMAETQKLQAETARLANRNPVLPFLAGAAWTLLVVVVVALVDGKL